MCGWSEDGINEYITIIARRPSILKSPLQTGKASKGLRHFSMKVCKKVEEKGQTTYNEVADELVREFMSGRDDQVRFVESNVF